MTWQVTWIELNSNLIEEECNINWYRRYWNFFCGYGLGFFLQKIEKTQSEKRLRFKIVIQNDDLRNLKMFYLNHMRWFVVDGFHLEKVI